MDRPIIIPIKESIRSYAHVPPPEGYEAPEGFPECCPWHSKYNEIFTQWFEEFPDCCDYHRAMTKSSLGFKKAITGTQSISSSTN